jgi:hypothetical protein
MVFLKYINVTIFLQPCPPKQLLENKKYLYNLKQNKKNKKHKNEK